MHYLDDLKSKVVLVTGSSTGIGAAVAKGFAHCGSKVAVHCNASRDAGEQVLADVKTEGGEAILLQADVSQTAGANQVVEETVAAFGRLDVLVNNAGGVLQRVSPEEIDDDLLQQLIDLNIRSVVMACRAAVPHFKRQNQGNIINTGSIAARHGGGPGATVYASTKGFVQTHTRALARDLVSHNVRVNAVAPGAIMTPFHKDTPASAVEAWGKAIPMGRIGEPEDLVGAYLYLASDRMSGYVTGITLDVNGGWLLPY